MSDPDLPQSAEPTTVDAVEGDGVRDSHTDSWRMREDGAQDSGEHANELVGQTVAQRYKIERMLGRGGMGAVYLAEHTELHKQVALKVLHRYMSTNEEVVARFEREAVAAGRLAHPSIVAATDFGRLEDGSFYLALEYVDGVSLADQLKDTGPFEERRAVSIAYQICDALCTAHAAGIVHRDLKPDNVLLVNVEDGNELVKVVDFGIAKVSLEEDEQEGLTRAGLVFGTPEYMSPEQAMGHTVDARSDLYGIGMLLYEMLSGRSPFRAQEVTEMLAKQITEQPPALPEHIAPRLRDLVMWLLRKDPEERPDDAASLSEALAGLASELNYSLPPPRTSPRTRPEGNRKPSTPSIPKADGDDDWKPRARPRKMRGKIPLWLPLLALSVGVGLGVGAMLMNQEAVPSVTQREERELVDSEEQLLLEAGGGDRDAIFELRKLATVEQKKLDESANRGKDTSPLATSEQVSKQANRYFTLGRGYSIIKHHTAAIEMYREAVRLDPHLSDEPELLLDVRQAIAARDAVDDGLDFALNALGSHGADIIYDVYLDYRGKAGMTPVVARAMKIARSEELLEHATPALRVALRLQQAKFCGEYRDVIPDAVKYADDRSLQKLETLQNTRGCGSDAMNDCFICLRKEDVDLDGAVAQARSHPSPGFLTPKTDEPPKAQ